MNKKSGFGLIEVLAAAVVLGFLLVGLSILQKGNRENLLRVRARDAASIIAHHVLDSLGSLGINSLAADGGGFIVNRPYTYQFEGKGGITAEVTYTVQVGLLAATNDDIRSSVESTYFTNTPILNEFAKGLEATVTWPHRTRPQSIRVAKVVR